MRVALTLALLVALGPASVARAADAVSVAITLDRAAITVGDPILLTIVADAEAGYQVADPAIARVIGDFEVLETLASQQSRRPNGVTRWTFRYRVTAFIVGDLVLPPIDVPFVGPNGTTGAVRSPERRVHVASVIRDGEDTSDIKPLKPQLELPDALASRLWRLVVGLGTVAVFTVLAGLVFWLLLRERTRGGREERLTPVQRTLRELGQLDELRLPEQGKTSEHYARLVASLREYVVARFGIEPGHTSRELRAAMERAGVDRAQANALYEILREGDEVRFRHQVPYPAHAHNAVRAALDVVRRAATAEEYEIAALRPQ